jgi:hypothetical protein
MPSYAFIRAADALTCALPPGGLSVQLVGRLALVDAEEAYAELALAPPAPAPALPLHTRLIPAEDLPQPPADVHLLGLLQDLPTASSSGGAGAGSSGGGSSSSGGQQLLLRVLRVDVVRPAPGIDLALLEATLLARQGALNSSAAVAGR